LKNISPSQPSSIIRAITKKEGLKSFLSKSLMLSSDCAGQQLKIKQ